MFITRLLFERAWLLMILLLVAVFIAVQIWARRRTQASSVAVWIGLAAALLLPLLSIIVQTPREQIMEVCRSLARSVDSGDVPAIDAHLAADFTAADIDRDEFLERIADSLIKYRVDAVRLTGFEVTLAGDRAVAEFRAACNVRSADVFLDRLLSRWRLEFLRKADAWQVVSLEALPTPFSPIRGLGDVLR
jgi:hypothetical protein